MQRLFFTYSLIGFSRVNEGVITKTLLSNPLGIDSQKVPLSDLPTVVFFDMDSEEGQKTYHRLANRAGATTVFVSIALDHNDFAHVYKLNKFAYPSKLVAFLQYLVMNHRYLLQARSLYSSASLSSEINSIHLESYDMEMGMLASLEPELINIADDMRGNGATQPTYSKTVSNLADQF